MIALLSFTVLFVSDIAKAHSPRLQPYSSWKNEWPHHPEATQYKPSVACGYPGGGPTATIDAGVVLGTTTSLPAATATVNKFLGIPFAKSPPERFSPPESPGKFNEPINATSWSPACIQQFVYPKVSQEFVEYVFNNPAPAESEDCLYLNVYAPSTPAPADGRSVMFWIYGGSLQFGNAGQHAYDGSWFASYEDVIVVTANYRTNVFGFPSSPEIPITQRNLGFLDQRFALDWVQRNIAAFGGSPEKVTIFGESAGAFSVDALLTSYPAGSKPPFRGAICESGQYSYRANPFTSQLPSWERLSQALGCPGSYSSDLACVRAANATTIKNIIDEQIIEFNPEPDNVTLVSDPAQRRLNGDIAHIPVLGGTNAQEGRVFTVGTNASTILQEFLPNQTALQDYILAAYPIGSPGIANSWDQAAQIFTDYIFQCACAAWANATASVGIPAWRYYFNASFYNEQAYPQLGVYHSSEIELVFGTYYTNGNSTTQEYALSNTMMGAWARFAKNPMGGPGWNQVGTGTASDVLVGAYIEEAGGQYMAPNGSILTGAWDLGVLGQRGDVMGGGVTVIEQYEVDYRCGLWLPIYAAIQALSDPSV